VTARTWLGIAHECRIDPRRALWEAALERRGIERAEVSRAVDEPNGGYCGSKVK